MRGFPKNALMTRDDFDLLQQRAVDGDLSQAQMDKLKRAWQALLNGRNKYVFDRELADGENPDGGEPDYRVIESEDEATGDIVRRQYRLEADTACRMAELGLSASEVTGKIDELEGLGV